MTELLTTATEPRIRESVIDELARKAAAGWQNFVSDCERRRRHEQIGSSVLPYMTAYFDHAVERNRDLASLREHFFVRVYRLLLKRIEKGLE